MQSLEGAVAEVMLQEDSDDGHDEACGGSPTVVVPEAGADELVAIVEAMLFAAADPVPVARLVQVLGGVERRDILTALRGLAARFDGEGSGLQLVEVSGGWQLRTRAEHAPWIRRLLGGHPPRLSRPMLETLAIVAYRQPCTRPEIEAIRGVDVGAVLGTLVERRLVRILGRKDAPGRPILYGTTSEFLEVFGLPDLAALPPLQELGEVPALLMERDLVVSEAGVLPLDASSAVESQDGGPNAESDDPESGNS